MKTVFFLCSAGLLILCLSFSSVCLAEDPAVDVVIMKDGTVIKGTIVKLNTREVVIETLDGGMVTRSFEDILTFREEPLTPAEQTETAAARPEPASFFDRHVWEAGAELYTVTYEEPGLMEQTGVMAGLIGSYAYHNGWVFKGELRLAKGQVDYTSQGTGSMSDIDDLVYEARALVGYDVMMSDFGAVTFFSGFGYRYLEDDSAGRTTTTGHWGYLRESNYFYSPIGIESVSRVSERWRLSFLFEYDYFWKGKQESYLSDVDPAFGDVTSNQNSGYGLRVSLGLDYLLSWGVVSFEPYLRYWDISDSEVNTISYAGSVIALGWEPANSTTETGIMVSCRF